MKIYSHLIFQKQKNIVRLFFPFSYFLNKINGYIIRHIGFLIPKHEFPDFYLNMFQTRTHILPPKSGPGPPNDDFCFENSNFTLNV